MARARWSAWHSGAWDPLSCVDAGAPRQLPPRGKRHPAGPHVRSLHAQGRTPPLLRAAAPLAHPPRDEPARSRDHRRRFSAARQLPRDRPRPAQPRDGARLGAALDVPLRDQNALLRAAGFTPAFEEPTAGAAAAIGRAHGPHARAPRALPDGRASTRPTTCSRPTARRRAARPHGPRPGGARPAAVNLLRAPLRPALARPFVADWERSAQRSCRACTASRSRGPATSRSRRWCGRSSGTPTYRRACVTPTSRRRANRPYAAHEAGRPRAGLPHHARRPSTRRRT